MQTPRTFAVGKRRRFARTISVTNAPKSAVSDKVGRPVASFCVFPTLPSPSRLVG